MSNASYTAYSPLDLENRAFGWKVAAVFIGTLLLTASSYIEVPMYPVPVTMQTFAVTMIGALYGWRLGAATIVAWLVQGAAGLPVFAGGAGGLVHFAGPTAGYLIAFPVVGAVVGWLAERGWNGRLPVFAFLAALLGNALCLAMGGSWLAVMIGAEPAFIHGVAPFIIGGVLKSALAAVTLALLFRNSAKA